jgi:hypothetical protein
MILFLILSAIIGVFGLIMGFFPNVDSLPYDTDYALSFFVGTVKSLIEVMPIFEVVWNLIILAFGIKFLLFTWTWFRWLIERVK